MALSFTVTSIVRDSILEDIKMVGFEGYLEALYFVLGNGFDEFMAQDIADEILSQAFRDAIAAYKNYKDPLPTEPLDLPPTSFIGSTDEFECYQP